MATAKAAPLSILPAGTEEEQQKFAEVERLRQQLKDALDYRKGFYLDPTMLAIAQGFSAPTRTGSFVESLGNVATNLGQAQEAERKRAQEIAQMRLELASSEYGMMQRNRLLTSTLPQLFGDGSAQGAAQGAAQPSAEGAPSVGGTLTGAPASGAGVPTGGAGAGQLRPLDNKAMLALQLGAPDVAKSVMDLMKFNREAVKMTDNGLIVNMDTREVLADLRASKQEPFEIVVDGKSMTIDMTPEENYAYRQAAARGQGKQFYEQNLAGRKTGSSRIPAGGALQEVTVYFPSTNDTLNFRATPRQAAEIENLQEQAAKSGNYRPLMDYLQSIGQAARPSGGAAEPSATEQAPQRPPERPRVEPIPIPSDIAGLPIADQYKIQAERVTSADAPAKEQQNILMQVGAPNELVPSTERLKKVNKLATDYPQVTGLMYQQGVMSAIYAGAQEGLRVGSYQISAPVEASLAKLKLNPKEQEIAREITRLLNEEFFFRSKAYKSLLGPQISNADATFMKSPMASVSDPANLLRYWTMHGILMNKQNDEMYRALNSWQDATKGKVSARQFFNKEGREIMNRYSSLSSQLHDQYYPRTR